MPLDLVTLSNNDFPLSKSEFPSIPPIKDIPPAFFPVRGCASCTGKKGHRRFFLLFAFGGNAEGRLRRWVGRTSVKDICGGPSLRRER